VTAAAMSSRGTHVLGGTYDAIWLVTTGHANGIRDTTATGVQWRIALCVPIPGIHTATYLTWHPAGNGFALGTLCGALELFGLEASADLAHGRFAISRPGDALAVVTDTTGSLGAARLEAGSGKRITRVDICGGGGTYGGGVTDRRVPGGAPRFALAHTDESCIVGAFAAGGRSAAMCCELPCAEGVRVLFCGTWAVAWSAGNAVLGVLGQHHGAVLGGFATDYPARCAVGVRRMCAAFDLIFSFLDKLFFFCLACNSLQNPIPESSSPLTLSKIHQTNKRFKLYNNETNKQTKKKQ
jgi:hypothetical protein